MPNKQAIIQTPEQLAEKLESYARECVDNKKKMTHAGLALYCGYESKQSLQDLKRRKENGDEFRFLMGQFSLLLEDQAVNNLLKPGQPTAGIIFNLKNNCGDCTRWVDKQDIESGGLVIKVVSSIDREE